MTPGTMTPNPASSESQIGVVIPCYRVRDQILDVLIAVPPEVARIYCVDDACPQGSGDYIEESARDPRVVVLRHEQNQGVGGATLTGYRQALDEGMTVVVKIDGDGQMDPALIPRFAEPLLAGECDYTKGNRFFRIEDVHEMPAARLFGNAVLSFATKLSSGYWNIFDPANGYTAIHAAVLRELPPNKISRRYFFESDMLFRLNTLGCVVIDIPITAQYGASSSLSIARTVGPFLLGHLRNFTKRVIYNYFLRDFQLASVQLVLGTALFLFGVIFGTNKWLESEVTGIPATAGTVMISALGVLVGIQLLLSVVQFDIANTPRTPIHPRLLRRPAVAGAREEARPWGQRGA